MINFLFKSRFKLNNKVTFNRVDKIAKARTVNKNILVFIAATLYFTQALSAQASETINADKFIKIANQTIQAVSGDAAVNIDKLISMQEQLIEIGIAGSKKYISAHPKDADILKEVVANAKKMKQMSLDEIEAQWHMGKHLASKGFDMHKYDHFGPLYSLMDSIIHPATSYISFLEYKRTKDRRFLTRASGELIEVVEHVKHIN